MINELIFPPIGKAAEVRFTEDGLTAKVPLLIPIFDVVEESCATIKYWILSFGNTTSPFKRE